MKRQHGCLGVVFRMAKASRINITSAKPIPMLQAPQPYVLVILDGWGYAAAHESNAITQAYTPCWDRLWQQYPHVLLEASGQAVGLPAQQIGSSEVGHLHIGAGRIVPQELLSINQAIACGDYFKHAKLNQALAHAQERQCAVHIIGLLSPGGIHSHQTHLHAMLELATRYPDLPCYIHAILDGRDTPPRSANDHLQSLSKLIKVLNHGKLASMIGRYYAMDRDQRWERTEEAYTLLTCNTSNAYYASDAQEALKQAYDRGESDEFLRATIIDPKTFSPIRSGDLVIFTNFRNDRTRQLTQALIDPNFKAFSRPYHPKIGHFFTMTTYQKGLPCEALYPLQLIKHTLGQCIAEQGYSQIRLAETEKYAHVTFFFNGRDEHPFQREIRQLIPSPKVATYNQEPEMSAVALTQQLVKQITHQQHALIVCNYANPDMLGHTGYLPETIQAIEAIDRCLEKVVAATLKYRYNLIITSDHGNAEQMYDPIHQQPHTAHTTAPVPCLHIGQTVETLHEMGSLVDIAPSILSLMGIPVPSVMDGQILWRSQK